MRGRVRRMWRKKQRALIRRRAPWSPDRSDKRHRRLTRARGRSLLGKMPTDEQIAEAAAPLVAMGYSAEYAERSLRSVLNAYAEEDA